MAAIVGRIISYILFVGIIALMMWGIFKIISSIQCTRGRANMYERFANKPQVPEVKQKIETYCLKAMSELLEGLTKVETAMDSQFPDYIDAIEDKTCKIYAEIKDSYIKNKTEMQDPTELEASDEDRKKLTANRLKRGAVQFDFRKKLYVAKTKIPLYECFKDAEQGNETPDISTELEETKEKLDEKVESVSNIFDSDDFQKRVSAIDKLQSTMGLNQMFLNESIMEIAKNRKENERKKAEYDQKKEGFEDAPTGVSYADMNLPFSMTAVTETQKSYVDSMKNAIDLIERMKKTPQVRSSMPQMFQMQNNMYDTLNQKKKELENPSDAELDKSTANSNKERAKVEAEKEKERNAKKRG
jgi:hypothetical protein